LFLVLLLMLSVVYSTLVLIVNVVALIMRVNVNVSLMLKVIMTTGLRVVWGFGFCRIAIVVNTTIETVVTGLTVRVSYTRC